MEPCFGIGHSLSLICQLTSEDIKHHFIVITSIPPPPPFSPSLISIMVSVDVKHHVYLLVSQITVQVLCGSRGGRRHGLAVLMSLLWFLWTTVKQHWAMHTRWSQFVICQPDIRGHYGPHHHHNFPGIVCMDPAWPGRSKNPRKKTNTFRH